MSDTLGTGPQKDVNRCTKSVFAIYQHLHRGVSHRIWRYPGVNIHVNGFDVAGLRESLERVRRVFQKGQRSRRKHIHGTAHPKSEGPATTNSVSRRMPVAGIASMSGYGLMGSGAVSYIASPDATSQTLTRRSCMTS